MTEDSKNELENEQDNVLDQEPVNELEPQNQWSPEDELENQKWMKKSRVKIVQFLVFSALILLFFILFYKESLFIFSVSNQTSEAQGSTLLFNILSYAFIVCTFIYMLYYLSYYKKRAKMDLEKQMNTFESFKKHFNVFDLLGVIPVFLAVLTFTNGLFYGFATVQYQSMQPTFCPGDYVVIDHFTNDYAREDIVIYFHDDSDKIKRLVGVPGDTIVVNSTGVYINDTLIEGYVPSTYKALNTIIPDGYYYFMGDNRTNSTDSRSYGLIFIDQILGEVVTKFNTGTCN